jgi:hypothetical protein
LVHDFFPAAAVELGLFLLVAEPENHVPMCPSPVRIRVT